MKTIVDISILLFLLIFTASIEAQNLFPSEIEVTVRNISSSTGTIQVGLYNTQEHFLKKPFKSVSITATRGYVTLKFRDIPAGVYAISLYHDKDSNGKLNTNFIGIPTEPYAASNNAKNMFGPPKWENAKFMVNEGRNEQVIDL